MDVDLFSVTAPLVIRLPDGSRHLMVERFPHPEGLLFFEPFWRDNERQPAVHLVHGPIRGGGPWKVGDAVVTVLGCREFELNSAWNEWQALLLGGDTVYSDRAATLANARLHGAMV